VGDQIAVQQFLPSLLQDRLRQLDWKSATFGSDEVRPSVSVAVVTRFETKSASSKEKSDGSLIQKSLVTSPTGLREAWIPRHSSR
jgi:hypothetical protein